MTGRKYELTVIVTAVMCALLAWEIYRGHSAGMLISAVLALVAGYAGANVIQDKFLGGKK